MERANMLEATGNVLQNLDRVLARVVLAVAAVEPGSDGEYDDNKRVPERGNEEEHSF